MPTVVMVGTFPPPLHGMAAVNEAVREQLASVDVALFVIDIAASSLSRGVFSRAGRLWKVLLGLCRLLTASSLRGAALYMSVSGGLGQLYECMFLLLARAKGLRVVLHHHNYTYLDRRRMLSACLVYAAGARATHVVLSEGMSHQFMTTYRCTKRPLVVSNAAWFWTAHEPEVREHAVLRTIGFISNLSAEKGVFIFLDVCSAITRAELPLRARLAGPFQDMETERLVRRRLATLPMVEYVGPQYGEAKQMFYRSLDVLLFPTRYVNEAEPLVVLEALQRGLPVIAYGRGAIPELLDAGFGVAVPPTLDFVRVAIRVLRAWHDDPAVLMRASHASTERFAQILGQARRDSDQLRMELVGEYTASNVT